MLPFFSEMQHPTEHTLIMRIAHKLYKIERELEGTTYWSYVRYDNPLENLEYQASILDTIGIDLTDIEADIAEIEDACVRSVLTVWYSGIYRLFFDRFNEFNKVADGCAD